MPIPLFLFFCNQSPIPQFLLVLRKSLVLARGDSTLRFWVLCAHVCVTNEVRFFLIFLNAEKIRSGMSGGYDPRSTHGDTKDNEPPHCNLGYRTLTLRRRRDSGQELNWMIGRLLLGGASALLSLVATLCLLLWFL
ncbi:hypothetical protein K505DRAFT_11152 [Melanomma pulvis-pyrius CBS 109.77]|uniref:Uncharacterized protein n=1 Tax=Melanomma pulvis-pyrius CBS 109.77 TaxID=1314802 RepID=A0A6A6WNK3_9PLEO|nr:hypothetical protein K505DRAFT_11152 [Melanomma pulvis-pyrius CBS 109.77]